jgi:general secretion pathway protein C
MNSFILRLQKNTFFILIPIVILLAYSIAYVIRSGIILLLPERGVTVQNLKDDRLLNQNKANQPVNLYEETVVGNLIRGSLPTVGSIPCPPDKPNCKPDEVVPMAVDPPEVEETVLTGCLSGNRSFARATFKDKGKEEAEEFAIGQKFYSYTIVAIAQSYAVLARDGRKLKIEIGQNIKDAKAVATEPIEVGVKIGDGKCQTISKIN